MTEFPPNLGAHAESYVERVYRGFAEELGADAGIRVRLKMLHGGQLPHQRYLITDQIALDIGRGCDLLDARGRLRSASVSLLSATQLGNLLRDYSLLSGAPPADKAGPSRTLK